MHHCCTFPGHSGPTYMLSLGEWGGGGGGGDFVMYFACFNTSPVN